MDPFYDGLIPVPRVGELSVGKYYRRITTGPVCFDLDSRGKRPSFHALLRHLWDADVKRGALIDPRSTL